MSRALRAGYDVVDQAVRRGFTGAATGPADFARAMWSAPWSALGAPNPLVSGPGGGQPGMGMWFGAMTAAWTMWTQWMTASMPANGGAVGSPPSGYTVAKQRPTPTSVTPATAGAPRISIDLRSPRKARIDLDLPPGSVGPFEIHGLLAPPALSAPPITDVSLSTTAAGVTISLGGIEQHPTGRYSGVVLAGERACGTLTVHVG